MKFNYKAIKDNLMIKGNIEAKDQESASQYLKSNNAVVISLTGAENSVVTFIESVISKVSFGDVVNLTRQLAIMLNAGLTLISSLDILKKQINKPALVKLINEIDDNIKAGISLSTALSKHHNLFGGAYIALVKAGEASGKLDSVLLRLAENLEKRRILVGKIKGAFIYPAVLVIGMIGVLFLMITFVVPKMTEIYKNFEAKLPPMTVALIAFSSFMQKFWPIVLVAIIASFFFLMNFYKTKQGKKLIEAIILKVPVISKVVKISALVEITRTFSILMKAGVSMLETIEIVKETSGLTLYQNAFAKVYKKVEKGESFARALDEQAVFPPILVQMAAVGEESGHIDETLLRLSQYFEVESDMAIKAMTVLIEPVILVILGLAVGFIVFAIITPIYKLTESLQ